MRIEFVLLPKEITLFSTALLLVVQAVAVLLPKEITLFSNLKFMGRRTPCFCKTG